MTEMLIVFTSFAREEDAVRVRIFGRVEPHVYHTDRGWLPYHAPGVSAIVALPFEYWGTLVLPRWNFAFSLGVPGSVGGASIDMTALLAGANTGQRVADRLDVLLMGGQMRPADKAALIAHLSPDPPSTTRIRDAFGLALASPGFQWY